jgi:PAP2 superfamily
MLLAPFLRMLLIGCVGLSAQALAAPCEFDCSSGGILGLDRLDEREDTGIFARKVQKQLDVVVIGSLLGMALWEGSATPRGQVVWKTVDSVLTTAVTTELMKNTFQRPRPAQNANPNLWLQGRGNKSFPSGETALMAAVVTPYIIENHERSPAMWGWVALPVYMATARMASQGHWASDVLAGAAVGVVNGYFATRRETPWVIALTGRSAYVGLKYQF